MAPGKLFDLSGTTAVVTGASAGGLGSWSAIALAEHGAQVMVSDRQGTEAALDETLQKVLSTGAEGAAFAADITSSADMDTLSEVTSVRFGKIDIFVNHAGVMLRKASLETSMEEWDRIVRINLTGTFVANQTFGRGMVAQGRGAIINTSSVYTNIVGPLPEAAYYASKAGVANLTRGLAAEWGPFGVTVNCLAPGVFYPTRMTEALGADLGRLAEMQSRTMLGRLGDPASDLAGTVVWLASRAARYVTGQVIFVDGGWSAK